ncbi:hypothetical protein [Candidatus Enterovibrio altilux]|uniref:hypothetical protein n=1 Tax=Candidatus Enterovibrio altilux TaxID=1927128 RepID=UPI00168170E9|nr:hypothetical protein [Candidatus Enterovibrio luxaltus]
MSLRDHIVQRNLCYNKSLKEADRTTYAYNKSDCLVVNDVGICYLSLSEEKEPF